MKKREVETGVEWSYMLTCGHEQRWVNERRRASWLESQRRRFPAGIDHTGVSCLADVPGQDDQGMDVLVEGCIAKWFQRWWDW